MTISFSMGQRIRRLAIINVLLLLLGLILLLPRWLAPQDDEQVTQASCELSRAPCQIQRADGSELTLSLGTHKLAPPQDLQITLTAKTPVEAVYWQFNGKSMPMYLPEEQMKQTAAGAFELDTRLALCITDPNMQWQAQLRIEDAKGNEQIRIDLVNRTPNSRSTSSQ